MERWQSIKRVPAPAFVPAYGGLSGMRVLMTGSVVAAPFAASIMAEHGAEVIRSDLGTAYHAAVSMNDYLAGIDVGYPPVPAQLKIQFELGRCPGPSPKGSRLPGHFKTQKTISY